MSEQHTHTTTPFTQRHFPIQILCDGLQSPANMGALFRIADAFGVEHIFFGDKEVPINSPRLRRTSRNTYEKVPFSSANDLISVLHNLTKSGYEAVALEITDDSISLQNFIPLPDKKVALVVGNEKTGISSKLLENCKQHLHIEMYGENSSMNVVQAVAIALYALTKH